MLSNPIPKNSTRFNYSSHAPLRGCEPIFYLMKQIELCGLHLPYEAPQAELLYVTSGQSILVSGSATLPDGIEEGDEDTFLPSR